MDDKRRAGTWRRRRRAGTRPLPVVDENHADQGRKVVRLSDWHCETARTPFDDVVAYAREKAAEKNYDKIMVVMWKVEPGSILDWELRVGGSGSTNELVAMLERAKLSALTPREE